MNTDAIEKFMDRVRTSAQSRSKDIRLSLAEAQELVAAVGQLMARNITLLEKVVDQTGDTVTVTGAMDGGKF